MKRECKWKINGSNKTGLRRPLILGDNPMLVHMPLATANAVTLIIV